MPTTRQCFTLAEADSLIGARVKLVGLVPHRFDGETGTVTEHLEYRDGYALVVQWDIGYGADSPRRNYFTRDEFNESVREV